MITSSRQIRALAWREFKAYFDSPVGYVFLVIFLVTASWLFLQTYFVHGQATMRPFFELLPWILLFLVPAVSMRLWAEERRHGTLEVLMTLPVRERDLVMGKFLGSMAFMLIALLLTFPLVAVTHYSGSPDTGIIVSSYVGALLLAASFMAVGMYISSLTQNQIIAFVGSVFLLFLLMILSLEMFGVIGQLASLSYHYQSLTRGVIDTRDVLYYLSVIGFFLYLTIFTLRRP